MTHRQAFVRYLCVVLLGCSGCTLSQRSKSKKPALTANKPADTAVINDFEVVDMYAREPQTSEHVPQTQAQVQDFVARLGQNDAAVAVPVEEEAGSVSAGSAYPHESVQARRPAPVEPKDVTPNTGLDITQSGDPMATQRTEIVDISKPAAPVLQSVYVRNATSDQLVETPSQPQRSINGPLSTAAAPEVVTLDRRIEALSKQVQDQPNDAAAQWELRLLQLAAGNDEAAKNLEPAGSAASPESAQLLKAMVETAIATREALSSPGADMDRPLQAVQQVHQWLTERSELQIPTVALCTKVQTYGVYDEMPAGSLSPNRANRAIVYVEVGNFRSERTAESRYRTVLSGSIEVLTPTGQSLWRHEQPEIVDVSRQQRQDFFLAEIVTLPETVAAGEYVLKVTIQDQLSGKSNQAMYKFHVGNQSVADAR
jgi:hypothetical protein